MQPAPDRQCEQSGRAESPASAVAFHVLGSVPFEQSLALQRRLVYEVGGRDDGQISVLLCEHPELITIGRAGSRGHIRLTTEQLKRRGLDVQYVSRGGGCILHGPGQLAVYPIVPLNWRRWTPGQYMQRLQAGILESLRTLRISAHVRPGQFGVWGRSGLLAAMGVSIRGSIACHGAFINVNPLMTHYGYIDTVPGERLQAGGKPTMSCLVAERRGAVTMSGVRSAVIQSLSEAFGCERHYLFTGHPLFAPPKRSLCEPAARAS